MGTDEKDLTAEVLHRIKFKELHPHYSTRYRQIKVVEHLFPGEGIMKVLEIISYLKKRGFDKLTEHDIAKKYTSTSPGENHTRPLW